MKTIDDTPPQQSLLDAATAWETIQLRAIDLCLDQKKLGAGGGSAGGHLAAALALHTGHDKQKTNSPPMFLILFNPVIDNGPGGFAHELLGADWSWFSPLHNIAEGHPDTLFMVGDSDRLIPASTGENYCRLISALGSVCDLIVYDNAGHGWFNEPGFEDTLFYSLKFIIGWLEKPSGATGR